MAGDGGEGTARVIMEMKNGKWIEKVVTGPLPEMKVTAGYVWLKDEKSAVVEMAMTSGLELLTVEKRNPLKTAT